MILSRFFKEGLKMKNKNESGSIMLEVVAVLALMGVMGSMLFRQIYQRNQELHNIQMASEIRTVKEAFSAYIQANQAGLLKTCPWNTNDGLGAVVPCEQNDLVRGIKEYLPDGWFTEEDLSAAYTFTLWTYRQQDATQRQMFYGVVVPTNGTLPSSGWNFKRAARVALLIGADGGVYGPKITKCSDDQDKGCIAGTLGSWELEAEGIVYKNNDNNFTLTKDDNTYVAMTGLDIFAPEYLPPDGQVNLPDEWDLVLKRLHAYDYFSVGGADANCYTIKHDVYDPSEGKIRNDDIVMAGSGCHPLFWVDGEGTGKAYVATDLNIGAIGGDNAHDEALKLTKEGEVKQKDGLTITTGGVIKQKDGLTIDKDGRIIAKETLAADIGDLKTGESFVLDPARTSTMMDIRLVSRGGARLSDILPNYILKDTYTGSCWVKINDEGVFSNSDTYLKPNDDVKGVASWCDLKWGKNNTMGNKPETDFSGCPEGYNYAVVVTPIKFGSLLSLEQKKRHTHGITESASSASADHTHTTKGAEYITTTTTTGKEFVSETVSCQFFAAMEQYARGNREEADPNTNAQIHTGKYEYDGTGEGLHITMGYRAKNSTDATYNKCELVDYKGGEHTETLKAIIQTYCVWMPGLLDTQAKCEAAGYTWNGVNGCQNTKNATTLEGGQTACEGAGFIWTNNRCQYKYAPASTISTLSQLTGESPEAHLRRKAAVCKAAGYTWTSNGESGDCS